VLFVKILIFGKSSNWRFGHFLNISLTNSDIELSGDDKVEIS
jgi:hypothetical protein